MTDEELIAMARLAQSDDRMSTGALYGNLADRIDALRAALDEAEAALKTVLDRESAAYTRHDAALAKADAERDAANALLREIEPHLAKISGFFFDTFPRKEIRAHLGTKP